MFLVIFYLAGWTEYASLTKYSKRLKSKRSDFRAFQSCFIPKQFGFQTLSEIQTILFRFHTFGWSTPPTDVRISEVYSITEWSN